MSTAQTDLCCDAYLDAYSDVCRLRDFLAGEWQVKARATQYLPKLSEQTSEDYAAYKERATFLNATARTHEGLVGEIFRKDPTYLVPDAVEAAMWRDANLAGQSWYAYTRMVVSEVLGVGRGGTLVDWSEEEGRPYAAFYRREDILDWMWERRNGKVVLAKLVLSEWEDAPEGEVLTSESYDPGNRAKVQFVRVLRLTPEGQYLVQRYQRKDPVSESTTTRRRRSRTGLSTFGRGAAAADRKNSTYELQSETTPTRNGTPLTEIPFVWHDPQREKSDAPKLPLSDLCSLNLNHYRLSADHVHGLRYATLPTPWAKGFGTDDMTIGSAKAWVSDKEWAACGYLEATGAGLGGLAQKLDSLEGNMATLGARLLETQKREAESAEALSLRQAGETSVLAGVAGAISDSLSRVLQWCVWWSTPGRTQLPPDEEVNMELNTDFSSGQLNGQQTVQYVDAWVRGGFSYDTLFHLLKRGEVTPPGRELEDELRLMEEDNDRSMKAMEAMELDGPGAGDATRGNGPGERNGQPAPGEQDQQIAGG